MPLLAIFCFQKLTSSCQNGKLTYSARFSTVVTLLHMNACGLTPPDQVPSQPSLLATVVTVDHCRLWSQHEQAACQKNVTFDEHMQTITTVWGSFTLAPINTQPINSYLVLITTSTSIPHSMSYTKPW